MVRRSYLKIKFRGVVFKTKGKKMKSVRIALIGAMALMSTSAFAGFKFGVHYMPGYSIPMATGIAGLGGFNLMGPGASLNYMFGANQMFGLHVEGAYVNRNFSATNTGAGIYSAIGPRLTVKNVLSFFVGGGYYIGMTANAAPFGGLANAPLVTGGLDVDIPVMKVMALTFGARYALQFGDAHTGAAVVMPATVMGQVGLRFGTFGK